jgi:hypothetical protein
MDYEFEGHGVDTRETLKLSVLKNGKGFVETPWKVFLNSRDMSLNDVIVIEHPFGARRESFTVVSGFSETLIYPFEHLPVVLVRLEKSGRAPTAKCATVRFGQLKREFGQCLPTENLRSPGRFSLLAASGESSFRYEG